MRGGKCDKNSSCHSTRLLEGRPAQAISRRLSVAACQTFGRHFPLFSRLLAAVAVARNIKTRGPLRQLRFGNDTQAV